MLNLSPVVRGSILGLSMMVPCSAIAAESFIDQSEFFGMIENPLREAEAWGMCAATYEMYSLVLADTDPAKSKYLHNLSNGAQMAIMVSQLSDWFSRLDLSEVKDNDPVMLEWNNLFSSSKVLMESQTEVQSNLLMMQFEMADSPSATEEVFGRLSSTLEHCVANGELQQMYVDLWREIIKTPLVQVPN